MKKFIERCKTILHIKKPEPWYKKCLRKLGLLLDMKRRNKFITFFALLFIAVYFCLPSLENIVKKAVHKYGSEITGTDVSLSGFDIKLSSGQGHVKGIKVGNPKGYKSKNLFLLQDISVKINIASITEETIIINSIVINKPVITYEMLSLSQNNILDVMNNINSKSSPKTKPKKETRKNEPNETIDKSRKIIIKNLTVRNGEIQIMTGAGSFKKPIIISLPDIKMHNIGQEKQGASVPETISKVLSQILQTTSQTIVNANLKGLQDASLKEIKGVSESIKTGVGNTATELKDEGKRAASKAKNAADGIKNSLGGMFQ